MENIKIYQVKNKYGYTIKQIRINYNKKIFEVGAFRIGADFTFKTQKACREFIEEIKKTGFVEV